MTIIKIDEKEYNVDILSEETKGQLLNMQFVDAELARVQALAAVLQTARIAYSNALNAALSASAAAAEQDDAAQSSTSSKPAKNGKKK